MGKKIPRVLLKIVLRLLALMVLAFAAYIAYLFMTYHRLPDTGEQHSSRTENPARFEETYTALTWNLGFGAYNRDFSFFMDGGTESRARSLQHVYDNIVHCVDVARRQKPDFALFQEVDRDADRSWHIDEVEIIRETLGNYQSYYAQNYSSAYLIFPFHQPHGASKSGILSFADRDIYRAERRQLPVETGWRRFLDLDRCYSVCRVPTEDGRELCVFNLHLSAYTADGAIATEQLRRVLEHMREEYDRGNYAIAGGDFNKDLLGDSGKIFGVDGSKYPWAQPVDRSLFPEGLRLVDSLDPDDPIPTCRNCDTGYIPGRTFVVTVDGFIVSDNIDVIDCRVIDDDFTATDHNPVVMQFRLRRDAPENESDAATNIALEEPTT